jgi:hypothetical protein
MSDENQKRASMPGGLWFLLAVISVALIMLALKLAGL